MDDQVEVQVQQQPDGRWRWRLVIKGEGSARGDQGSSEVFGTAGAARDAGLRALRRCHEA